ncbi:MAG: hypothetical protein LIP01_10015 [Tannerellaceae bacterium]|nr:hypothetical protein [Tannerellaceae bacterium]
MKITKRLLYLLIAPLLCSGCIDEDLSGCPGTVYVEFQYKGSTKQFDEVITNDIFFHFYHNGIAQAAAVIPFDAIKGGNPYTFRKQYIGETEVMGWTVPIMETVSGKIPQATLGKKKEEAKIELELLPGIESELYKPLDFLHRGAYVWTEKDLTGDSRVSVSVSPVVCKLTVLLYDEASPLLEEKPGIEISGLQKELSLDLQPSGDDVIISGGSNLTHDGDKWDTGFIFLPPSQSGKNLSFKIIPQNASPFIIHTQYESVAEDELLLEIRGRDVIFKINGWRRLNVRVQDL